MALGQSPMTASQICSMPGQQWKRIQRAAPEVPKQAWSCSRVASLRSHPRLSRPPSHGLRFNSLFLFFFFFVEGEHGRSSPVTSFSVRLAHGLKGSSFPIAVCRSGHTSKPSKGIRHKLNGPHQLLQHSFHLMDACGVCQPKPALLCRKRRHSTVHTTHHQPQTS
ncbi:hypothetical protein LZ32DRAFT_370093 [Colletotrichum eremochloae]|nr:hypothetical protein LZ32DRAFT_370093 [Colletotrichum eremochloae]